MNLIKLLLTIFGSKVIYRKDEISGGYIAFRRKNDGIVSQGATKEEALANLKIDTQIIKYGDYRNS